MGDYHTQIDGQGNITQHHKLGVMDDFRYVRRSELAALQKLDAGKSCNVRMVLANAGTLYRFPWPDEDLASAEESIEKRNMFRTAMFTMKTGDWFRHGEVSAHINASEAFGQNIVFPCPLSDDWPKLGIRQSGPFRPVIRIVGERYDERGPRTIFECGYCASPFSMSPGKIELARCEFRDQNASAGQWADKIAERFAPAIGPVQS